MQQRYFHGGSGSSPSPIPEVNPTEQQQHTKRSLVRRMSSMADFDHGGLPVYDPHSGIGKKEIGRSRLAEKWVHAIPLLVLLCLFILWWFCYPVTLEIKEGRIVAIHPVDDHNNQTSSSSSPPPLNNTRVEIAALAVATISLLDAVPRNFTGENGTDQ
ncbi:hypothetical protein TorRG33x02_200540 [Trema orientale]|uniref:Transmembrane protein n=1 Tax=Trema orientale TaxID=63057 RepID=A0A2P5EF60_TREOI|nr:hypothetical protein TorRG33x02_200540 [Trema orientale]